MHLSFFCSRASGNHPSADLLLLLPMAEKIKNGGLLAAWILCMAGVSANGVARVVAHIIGAACGVLVVGVVVVYINFQLCGIGNPLKVVQLVVAVKPLLARKTFVDNDKDASVASCTDFVFFSCIQDHRIMMVEAEIGEPFRIHLVSVFLTMNRKSIECKKRK